jgi:hypothetical protein
MADKVYKQIRVVGCSSESIEKAIALAVDKAAKTVHGLAWFQVVETRGAIKDGVPAEWQVTVDLGFRLD